MLRTNPRTSAETVGVSRPPLLKALTSVGFFAALQVALYHFVRPFALWGALVPLVRVGYVGVSFFFFLSGYILTYSHAAEYEGGRGDARRFWVARIARIYPVYLLSMIAAAYVQFGEFAQRKHIIAFVADLFMVQSWSIRLVPFFHTTAWTLSVEAFFYLLFPFIFLRLQPPSATRAWLMIACMWILAMAAPAIGVHFFPDAAWHGEGTGSLPGKDVIFSIQTIPLFALPEFLAGVSLGWLFLRFRPRAAFSSTFVLTGFAGMMIGFFISDHLPSVMLHNGLLIPFYALLLLGLSYPNWYSRLLSARWLTLLGEASYSFYLIHFLFNDFVKDAFHAGETKLDAIWKLAIVIPLAIAFYLTVERPGRRRILRWWTARTQPKVEAAPADLAA